MAEIHVDTLTIPDTGAFVIGRNLVGDALTSAGVELEWTDIGCEARRIHIERGGKRSGVATTLDVGTLSLSTVNAWNPADEPTIKPNTPIRVWTPARVWPFEQKFLTAEPGTYEPRTPEEAVDLQWNWATGETTATWPSTTYGINTVEMDPWGSSVALVSRKTELSTYGASRAISPGFALRNGSGTLGFRIRAFDVAAGWEPYATIQLAFQYRKAGSADSWTTPDAPSYLAVTDAYTSLEFAITVNTGVLQYPYPMEVRIQVTGTACSFAMTQVDLHLDSVSGDPVYVPPVLREWDWTTAEPSSVWSPAGTMGPIAVEADPWGVGTAMVAEPAVGGDYNRINSDTFLLPEGDGAITIVLRVFGSVGGGTQAVNLYSPSTGTIVTQLYDQNGVDDEYTTIVVPYSVAAAAPGAYIAIQSTGWSVAVQSVSITNSYSNWSDLLIPQTFRDWDWTTEDPAAPWGAGTVGPDPWATGQAMLFTYAESESSYLRSESFTLPAGTGTVSMVLRSYDVTGATGYGAIDINRADDGTEIVGSSQWKGAMMDYDTIEVIYDLVEPTEVYLEAFVVDASAAIRSVEITSDGILYQDTSLFTGNLEDVQVDYDRKGNSFVAITAADAVKQHNNVQRYGAVVEGGVGYETWASRIRRLAESATADVNPPGTESDQDRTIYSYNPYRPGGTTKDGWSTFGVLGGGTLRNYGALGWYRQSSANVSITPGDTGIRRTMSGLTVGARYRVEVGLTGDSQLPFSGFTTWAVGVTGKDWSEPETQVVGSVIPMIYEFIATSTSHVVNIALYMTDSYDAAVSTYYIRAFFQDIKVTEVISSAIVLQDIVYESSLANHFDLASNSIGGAWWVDEDNVTQFAISLPDSDPYVVRFSDVHEDGPWPEGVPPHVCYTNIGIGYDTTNVVNDLTMNNHGRDAGTGDADDVTYGFQDITSSANWGPRQATVETSIKTDGIYAGSVNKVAGWILETSKEAALAVTSVTFLASDFPAVQIDLDIYSRVQVTRNGIDYSCRVVAITHDIEATTGRWFTTLALTKEISNG